jgi:hypothetical protein
MPHQRRGAIKRVNAEQERSARSQCEQADDFKVDELILTTKGCYLPAAPQ